MKLLDWLKSWFVKGPEGGFEVYHPGERAIYSYFDGAKMVRADPVVLYKELMAVRGDLWQDSKVAHSTLVKAEDAKRAHDSLIGTIRGIFKVKPLEEGGLTESEAYSLMDHFLSYTDRVKKNSNPSPTPSTPTGDSSSTSAEGPTTPPSSDSGSTENGSSSAAPGPSPSASASPTAT